MAAAAVTGINPVRVEINGHPANSGFLAFVEQNISLDADESEGTMAMGGNLIISNNYNVAAGSPPQDSTYTAPGDSGPTFLHVGGGITWADAGASVRVENAGFTKIANANTYDAFNTESNGAQVNYRVVTRSHRPRPTTRLAGSPAPRPTCRAPAVRPTGRW